MPTIQPIGSLLATVHAPVCFVQRLLMGGAMCPACQNQTTRPNATQPHQRQFRYALESRRIEGIGQMVIDFFLCERCGTRMQRDSIGLGRRRKWRAAA